MPDVTVKDSPATSLTSKTLHGLTWSYIDTIINAVLQIGYTAVMARLLSPADFGLVAMGNVVLRFGSYFAQMGMGSALVQKKELSQEEIRAGFTSSVLLSIFVYGIIWILAPLSILLFKNPDLIPIVRVLGLSFVLTGLSITSISILRRGLAFRSIAIIDIISFVLGYGIGGIYLALNGFGVWSLVAAALSQSAIQAILAFLITRHSLIFIFGWKHFKQLYSFGSRVSVISFMEFISSNLDTLAIGHSLGDSLLGVYNRAYMLVNLPMYNLVISFSKVLTPAYSRAQTDTYRLKKAYISTVMLIASILIPTCWGLSVAAREVVLLVLGEKWSASITILQVLAFATPFNLLTSLASSLLEATAKLNIKVLLQAVYILFLGILFFLLSPLGVNGFAIAVVIGELILFISYTVVTARIFKLNSKDLFTQYIPALISGLIIGLLIFGVGYFFRHNGSPIWLTFFTEFILGAVGLFFFFAFASSHRILRREIYNRLLTSNIVNKNNSMINKLFQFINIGQKEPQD